MVATIYSDMCRADRRELVLRVAKECHLHPNTASLYLRGKRNPSPLTAEKIAEVLGQPVEKLFNALTR